MTELLGKISELVSAGLGVDFSQILIQLIAITILFLVVKVKLWAPITKNIEARQDFIEEQVKLADKTKIEAIENEEKNKLIIDKAKSDAREIMQKAQTLANKEAEIIISDAKEKANQEIETARIIIEQDTQKARKELQNETVDIAFELASKIVNKEVSKNDNKEIVDEFLKGANSNAS